MIPYNNTIHPGGVPPLETEGAAPASWFLRCQVGLQPLRLLGDLPGPSRKGNRPLGRTP